MHGQEALFSENMPLKEVIAHLEQQKVATTPAQENARALLEIPKDVFLAAGESGWTEEGCRVILYLCTVLSIVLFVTGHENTDDGCQPPWNTSVGSDGVNSAGTVRDSLCTFQRVQYQEFEDRDVSYGVPQVSRRVTQDTSRSQEVSLRAPSSEEVLMEVQPVFLSLTEQSEETGDGYNATDVSGGVIRLTSEGDSIFIIQGEQYSVPDVEGVSYREPQDLRIAVCSTRRSLDRSLWAASPGVVPMEVPGFLCRPEQSTPKSVPLFQNHEANSTFKGNQERLQRDPNHTNARNVPEPSNIPATSPSTRKHTRRRGHSSVRCARQAFTKSRNFEFMRSYTRQGSLSHAMPVEGPSDTRPTCRLMRGSTQERSHTPAPCVIAASASHPHTTVTSGSSTNQNEALTPLGEQGFSLRVSSAH